MMSRALAIAAALCLSFAFEHSAIAGKPANAMGGKQPASEIVIRNFMFMPMAISVHAGDMVTWTNRDGEPHTVTSLDGLFRSGALDEGDSFKFKFARPGIYKYVCTIHPRMTGTITVK